jgi:hypothetical protein
MPALGAFKNCFSPEKQQIPPFYPKFEKNRPFRRKLVFRGALLNLQQKKGDRRYVYVQVYL